MASEAKRLVMERSEKRSATRASAQHACSTKRSSARRCGSTPCAAAQPGGAAGGGGEVSRAAAKPLAACTAGPPHRGADGLRPAHLLAERAQQRRQLRLPVALVAQPKQQRQAQPVRLVHRQVAHQRLHRIIVCGQGGRLARNVLLHLQQAGWDGWQGGTGWGAWWVAQGENSD